VKRKIFEYARSIFLDAQNLTVDEPIRISEGWETEIYSFEVNYDEAGERRREALILRVFPGENAASQAQKEFRAMKRLHRIGYPVPRVLHLSGKDTPFGKPAILMERVEGDVLWSFLFHPETNNQEELFGQFCSLLVRLHHLDWRAVADGTFQHEEENPYQFVDQWLDSAQEHLSTFDLRGFEPTLNWLQERRDLVPCAQPAVIHYDFHPANILWRSDNTAVVIDWSAVEVSDPRFDLAWTMLLLGAYEGWAWRDKILELYERLTGSAVEQITFFEVSACLRRLFSIAVSLQGDAAKLGMDPNAVTLINRQMPAHRRVYDLLLERTGLRIPEIEGLFA
jgi:aminoglycoside phosphotransferase (APT) family kinase protein